MAKHYFVGHSVFLYEMGIVFDQAFRPLIDLLVLFEKDETITSSTIQLIAKCQHLSTQHAESLRAAFNLLLLLFIKISTFFFKGILLLLFADG